MKIAILPNGTIVFPTPSAMQNEDKKEANKNVKAVFALIQVFCEKCTCAKTTQCQYCHVSIMPSGFKNKNGKETQ